MNRFVSVFMSIYFLAGSALLPKGDFGITAQLSCLYESFIQLNG